MPALTAVEWDLIEARINAVMRERRTQKQSLAFLYLVLDQFFPGRSTDFAGMITEGGSDFGVDAIEVLEKEDIAEVILFQSKHRSTLKSTDRTINDADVNKICSFLQLVFNKSEKLIRNSNYQINQHVKRIWQLHEAGVVCRYRVVFCTNGASLSSTALPLSNALSDTMHGVTFEVYGPKDLIKDFDTTRRTRENGVLQVVGREILERTDGDVRGLIASVDALSFVDLIRTDDGRSVKRHLFDENLRVFLGTSGGFNSDIIKTAVSNDSHLFWYLNNGITITCNNYAYNKGLVSPKIRIEDFQIVNGAQTSHSLIEAARKAPDALENVVLMVRVYATQREDIAARVAVATNSQARIQSRDLRANTEVMKKLEMSFSNFGYYFERKRNMHVEQDPRQRIDALKLGQIILSFYLKEPDRAKTESDSIFGERFHAIFHERHDILELCKVFELYNLIENMKDDLQHKRLSLDENVGDDKIIIYGHWFILYVCSLILSDRGRQTPVGADAKLLIDEAITIVSKACMHSKHTSHYVLFRSPRMRERVESELRGKQMSLFDLIPASD